MKDEVDKLETEHTNLKGRCWMNEWTLQHFPTKHFFDELLTHSEFSGVQKYFSSSFFAPFWHVTAEFDKEKESLTAELEALKKQLQEKSPVCAFVKTLSDAG